MKNDHVAIQDAQRRAFRLLGEPFYARKKWTGTEWMETKQNNLYHTLAENITMPAHLVQEQAFTTATGQVFSFDFSINAPTPQAAPLTNNVVLGNNNTAAIYAVKILQGEGAAPSSRIYRSFGVTPVDDCLYNSVINVQFETSTLIKNIPGKDFKDSYTTVTEFDSNSGLVLINPQRILTGKLGVFNLSINIIQSIAALVLTPNLFISAQLYCALGQAQATK
jgi:hypothetical protein